MCTGLVSGTEFVAFNDSPVCSSFRNPRPPDAPAPADAPATPTAEEIALLLLDEAVATAAPPNLKIVPSRVGLTGLDSFFWTDPPRPIQVTATVPGLTVTAEARPRQYVWGFGDGARRTTTRPGRPWTRRHNGTIGHTYETRGSYDVTLEVVWEARWRAGTREWRYLGYFTTADSANYPVRQVIALLVKPR